MSEAARLVRVRGRLTEVALWPGHHRQATAALAHVPGGIDPATPVALPDPDLAAWAEAAYAAVLTAVLDRDRAFDPHSRHVVLCVLNGDPCHDRHLDGLRVQKRSGGRYQHRGSDVETTTDEPQGGSR